MNVKREAPHCRAGQENLYHQTPSFKSNIGTECSIVKGKEKNLINNCSFPIVQRLPEIKKFLSDVIPQADFITESGSVRVLMKPPDKDSPVKYADIPAEAGGIAKWFIARYLENPERLSWRCFYSPSVSLPGESRLIGKTAYINTLVFDLDDVSLAEAKRRCRDIGLLPMYFVESGSGVHIYIALDGIYLDGADNWKAIYNGINDLLGGDKGSGYRHGYMRTLPFTYNAKPKYKSPRLVKLHKAKYYARYNIEELREILRPQDAVQGYSLGITTLFSVHKKGKLEFVRWLGMLKRDLKLRAIVNGKDERIKESPSGSECDFIYALALFTRGFSSEFVYERLWDWDWGIAKHSRRQNLSKKDIESRLKSVVKGAQSKMDLRYAVLSNIEAGKRRSARSIAKRIKCPVHKVSKVLKELCEEGIVEKALSFRGGKGKAVYTRPIKTLLKEALSDVKNKKPHQLRISMDTSRRVNRGKGLLKNCGDIQKGVKEEKKEILEGKGEKGRYEVPYSLVWGFLSRSGIITLKGIENRFWGILVRSGGFWLNHAPSQMSTISNGYYVNLRRKFLQINKLIFLGYIKKVGGEVMLKKGNILSKKREFAPLKE